MKRRIIVTLLAVSIMGTMLTACGDNNTKTDGGDVKTSVESSQEASTAASEKYEQAQEEGATDTIEVGGVTEESTEDAGVVVERASAEKVKEATAAYLDYVNNNGLIQDADYDGYRLINIQYIDVPVCAVRTSTGGKTPEGAPKCTSTLLVYANNEVQAISGKILRYNPKHEWFKAEQTETASAIYYKFENEKMTPVLGFKTDYDNDNEKFLWQYFEYDENGNPVVKEDMEGKKDEIETLANQGSFETIFNDAIYYTDMDAALTNATGM